MAGKFDYDVFIKTIKKLQRSRSFAYNMYSEWYKNMWNKNFKISSVAIIMKIKFKQDLESTFLENKNQIEFLLKKNNFDLKKIYSIRDFENTIKEILIKIGKHHENPNNLFSVEILLLKRAMNKKDRYSGEISFPGGKFEEKDLNTFTTAIRETHEEIGINIGSDSVHSNYLGEMNNIDMTIDFKYVVRSQIFLVMDLFNEFDSKISLNKKEISDFVWVPLSFFKSLERSDVKINHIKKIKQLFKFFNYTSNVQFGKIILNQNENFLLYGLTRRIIINLLDLNYRDDFYIDNKFKLFMYKLILLKLKILMNPKSTYNLGIIICMMIGVGQ